MNNTHSLCTRLWYRPISRRGAVTLMILVALALSICIAPIQLAATNVGQVHRLERQCRSGKHKACNELAKIALREKRTSVRREAAKRLNDQALLAKIAVEDQDARVRSAAMAKLTDQSLLAKIALEATEASIRSAAVVKLTDQSLLAKIALEATQASIRSAAVAELTDQSLLAKIVLEAPEASIRSAAVARLADRSLLAKIALEDKDASVRSAAVAAAQQVLRDITEGRDIVDLLNEKKIEIEAQGSGIEQVWVRMRRLVPYSVTVRIPVGTFFVSSNPSAQNMVTTREDKVSLTNEQWLDVIPQAACANRPRHVPGSGDAFQVERSPHQEELAKLMPVLERSGVDTATRQAAVWIVTDNANYDALGILVASPYGAAYRVINEQEAALAMKIVDEAGIDITKKAIWKDRFTVFSRLKHHDWLDRKAYVSAMSAVGGTPLHAAAASGDKDIAGLLLAGKTDVNAKDSAGRTPLHYAALFGHKDAAELLLANKADVNAKASNGVTPLHFAAGRGHKEVVELLRQHGGHE